MLPNKIHNTHLSRTQTQVSAFCEPVKWQSVLQMFKILRDQFLNLQNRSQYQKIMFTLISCWNTTNYLLSSFKCNFKSKSLIPCLWASIKAFSIKTYQQAQQFNKPIIEAIRNTYITLNYNLVLISNHDKKGNFPLKCLKKVPLAGNISLPHSLKQFHSFQNSQELDFKHPVW